MPTHPTHTPTPTATGPAPSAGAGWASKPTDGPSDRLGVAEAAMLDWLFDQAGRARRLSAAHPVSVDLLVGVALLAASFIGLATQERLTVTAIVAGVALCLPLALHRRRPEVAFGLVLLVGFLQWLISVPQLADAALLIGLYTVAARSRPVIVVAALSSLEAGAIGATLRWVVVDPLKVWVGLSALAVAAAGAGIVIRQRRELLESLRERADRLEFERDQQGRLAAAAERARIAREMHDIVSHNLTVMIALADGARFTLDSSPEAARPAVERISATGRQALVEMRRLLGVLRDDPQASSLEPQPSLARLDELISRVEAAGIPVSFTLTGDPGSLSQGLSLTVFRVAQEALTNVLKHAVAPTRASLTLTAGPGGRVELTVADDGRVLAGVAAGSPAPERPTGRGLAGMRERAAAYGGELIAGPAADGGWRVHLLITG
ncbi:sensor histidine kinase [Conexibacter sp. DBS9H8]|uniref:sensor histidine kinase n=1 Tax=Conexibacter sp. DBS9H8 TaxID=2937801 RepID=UPI00200D2D24|nr:histidine kinase [Conexibacter sp. DBS9H8]